MYMIWGHQRTLEDGEDLMLDARSENGDDLRKLMGISLTELARHLGLSIPGVGYAVERGEAIVASLNVKSLTHCQTRSQILL